MKTEVETPTRPTVGNCDLHGLGLYLNATAQQQMKYWELLCLLFLAFSKMFMYPRHSFTDSFSPSKRRMIRPSVLPNLSAQGEGVV